MRLLVRTLCILLLVIAATSTAAAQQCRPVRLAELPVTLMGNVPVVTVHINGAAASLLFDTGAERTVLTSTAAKRLHIEPHYEYTRRMRSLDSAVASGDATVRSLDFGTTAFRGVAILVGSLSLPNVGGKPLDGLLGADFFSSFEVDLDLEHRRVTLFQPPSCPISAPAWATPYATIKANLSLHDRLFFPVLLDGHQIDALIDTGAQLTTLDADTAAQLGVSGAELARDPDADLRGAAAEVVKARAHKFARLQIDGEMLRDQVIVVTRLGLQDADLVLGSDFLHWQRVWLSYPSHQIFLQRHS
ncbi:MAG: retroviral-like aspartic protease family protein [Stellaceae bacterium]